MRIRPAALTDAPALAHVHVSTWRAAYRDLMPEELLQRLSVEERARSWERLLTHSPHITLLAESREQVLGFASFGASRDLDAVPLRTAELYPLYVEPAHWGFGVGWQLWRAARDALIVEEFDEVTLWVLEANHRGRMFYERVGYVVDPAGRRTVEFHCASLPEFRYRMSLQPGGKALERRLFTCGAQAILSFTASRPPCGFVKPY
jgi:GNAT superfamily N-acetyltransferase